MSNKTAVSIHVRIDADKAERFLKGMSKRSSNLKPVFDWAQRELEKANAENFTASGLPSGGWAPLSASYSAWKLSHFPGDPIMVRGNGKLFRSLADLNNSARVVNDMSAEFGTTVEYARFHQYGTTKMPARKLVFEPVGFSQELGRQIEQHIINDNMQFGSN